MDSSIILSLIGICISLYAISSPSNKRNLQAKLSIINLIFIFVIAISLIITIVLSGYYKIDINIKYISYGKIEIDLDYYYSVLSLFLLIIFSAFIAYIFFSKRILNKNILLTYLRNNLNNSNYGYIISDIDEFYNNFIYKHKEFIERAEKDNPIRKYLENPEPELTKSKIIINKIYNYTHRKKIRFSIKYRNYLYDLLTNQYFTKELGEKNPVLGVKLINSNIHIYTKQNYVELFLKELMKNKNSILYSQVLNNQVNIPFRYQLVPENYLLCAIFKDIHLAKKLSVYKPIGDGVIDYLKGQKILEDDVNNMNYDDFEDHVVKSPIYIGMLFFDIMIRESIENNIKWHMWLYYFPYFIRYISDNISYENIKSGEFINLYERYIYELFHTMKQWVMRITSHDTKFNIDLEEENGRHENGNIIKSTVIAICESMDIITETKNIRDDFIVYIFNSMLNMYFDLILSDNPRANSYGRVYVSCITNRYPYRSYNPRLLELMNRALDEYDMPVIITRKNGHNVFDEFREKINSSL
ncbi:MAG: hypothetical protein JXJ19_06290 [Elusimicrobia bacterium]|nr:hypothetical protein [Elusimicrobiota bacterium]